MKTIYKIFLFFVVLILTIPAVMSNPQILTYKGGHWLNDRNEDRTAYMAQNDVVFSTIQANPWVIEVVNPELTYYGSTTTTMTIKPSTFQFSAEPLAGTAYKGSWGWFVSSTQRNGGVFGNSASVNGDEYRWYIDIPAGNYTFVGFFDTANNRGIQEVWLNSSTYNHRIFIRDGYSSALVANAQHRQDFQLLEDLNGNITYKSNGKNSASSGYGLYYSSMFITSIP